VLKSSTGRPAPKAAAAISIEPGFAHSLSTTHGRPSARRAWDATNRQLVNAATAALVADVALRAAAAAAAGGAADPDAWLVRVHADGSTVRAV
jgi:hypothetical protein